MYNHSRLQNVNENSSIKKNKYLHSVCINKLYCVFAMIMNNTELIRIMSKTVNGTGKSRCSLNETNHSTAFAYGTM